MKHSYLDSPSRFKIFAHRGFINSGNRIVRDENTLEAFKAALEAGADYLELDVQSSSDGIAVVFHDSTLSRVSDEIGKVSERTWEELKQIVLELGGRIPSLDQVFATFPEAKINIDLKNLAALPNLVWVVKNHQAQNRILLTSFSEKRRKAAMRLLPDAATSPSAWLLFIIWTAFAAGIGLGRLLKTVNVLQIPVSYGILRLDSPRFIESVKRCGVELVYWTINDPAEALRLRSIGANGVVTDRTDLMISALD